jgi:hypothetical protein
MQASEFSMRQCHTHTHTLGHVYTYTYTLPAQPRHALMPTSGSHVQEGERHPAVQRGSAGGL